MGHTNLFSLLGSLYMRCVALSLSASFRAEGAGAAVLLLCKLVTHDIIDPVSVL